MNRAPTIGEIVRAFKARVTHDQSPGDAMGTPVWQRNDYEPVIRNEESLEPHSAIYSRLDNPLR